MRTPAGMVLVLLFAGCAAGLHRDGQCLAVLTPDLLAAHEEVTALEHVRRHTLIDQNGSILSPPGSDHDRHNQTPPATPDRFAVAARHGPPNAADEEQSLRALRAARLHYQETWGWYGKVYERLLTRLEEKETLTAVFMGLLSSPGLIFYPIIHWNVHAVYWEGTDPDADSDPITRYCAERVARSAGEEAAR